MRSAIARHTVLALGMLAGISAMFWGHLRGQQASTGGAPSPRASGFTLFESGQVRPLALSPDGSTLFAVNTPDNRLEVFRVTENGLQHRGRSEERRVGKECRL